MARPLKHIAYIGGYIDPAFARLIEAQPDLSLTVIDRSLSLAASIPALARAHVLQIDSARSSIPPHFLVGPDLLSQCKNLLMVSANGAGCDPIDLPACNVAGVLVVNQAGGNREAVAEHTLGMMLSLTKRIAETDRAMRHGRIADRIAFMGDDLHGKTIGLVGFGQVGMRVAELCRGLFAMPVIACDPYVATDAMRALSVRKADLQGVLHQSDFVSLHCPLTDETRGMIGTREFAAMKPGAFFLSTARGSIHDETALHRALASGHLAGAGLDVWNEEPPPADHPLLGLPNVIASPHTAGVTRAARRKVAEMAAEQIIAVLGGTRPARLLNPQAWPRFQERFGAAFAA